MLVGPPEYPVWEKDLITTTSLVEGPGVPSGEWDFSNLVNKYSFIDWVYVVRDPPCPSTPMLRSL